MSTIEENKKYTNVQVTLETYAKLQSAQKALAKILRKRSISFDVLFKLFFACHPLDLILMEMQLEENPSIRYKPKKVIRNEETP